MKRFLPSSVMLTPFVVRYYDEDESDQTDQIEMTLNDDTSTEDNKNGCTSANTDLE
ncbi:hypothetical protein ABMY36_02275 [Vibrio vulnificus]|uniref:hypothetical protein n=1 Tax=Vibrio vulnificus TaxID=672 RepID=UPI004059B007